MRRDRLVRRDGLIRGHPEQAARLQLGFLPLAERVRAPGDAPAGSEMHLAPLEPEGADGNVQIATATVGVDPSDGPAIGAAGDGLEPVDELEGRQLGGSGDRAGREGRAEEFGPSHGGTESSPNRAHEVAQARVCLHGTEVGHLDRAPLAHPPEVVADQVDDHHVLGAVLVQKPIRCRGGPLDRLGGHDGALSSQEALRRRRRHVDPVVGQAKHRGVGRWVASCQRASQGEDVGIVGERSRQTTGEVHLVDVAGGDRLSDERHTFAESVLVEVAHPRIRRRPLPPAGGFARHRSSTGEASAQRWALEGQHHDPETGAVECARIGRHIDQLACHDAADGSDRSR